MSDKAPTGALCRWDKLLVARRSRAAARLVLRDRLLQVAVFRAPEPARLVERGEALLRLGEIAGLQVELAGVFERGLGYVMPAATIPRPDNALY